MQDFAVSASLTIESSWPPPERVKALHQTMDHEFLEVHFTQSGRMRVYLRYIDTGFIFAEAVSPRIRLVGTGVLFLFWVINYHASTGKLELYINGEDVTSRSRRMEVAATLRPDTPSENGLTKDQASIDAALSARTQRVRDYERTGLTTEQKVRSIVDLKREFRLLSAANSALKRGDLDYTVPVSVHLRKLIGKGKGNHLLQDCAAFRGVVLPVWKRPPSDPQLWTPYQLIDSLDFWYAKEMFSLSPTHFLTCQTDIDDWLCRNGGALNQSPTTNVDLLHGVADKIGAHLDLKNRDLVEALENMHFGGVPIILSYLTQLGDLILALTASFLEGDRTERT
ncbi:hypothetical protein [Lichenibacterium ramalinae]|uniref:hypothetical protein n=1 Tax=Lichenibacterium ramalinae TaxID=2316527 RepID=UPI00100EB4EF|nr:hypothetical protein [Lichenibacterium ramalinae]